MESHATQFWAISTKPGAHGQEFPTLTLLAFKHVKHELFEASEQVVQV